MQSSGDHGDRRLVRWLMVLVVFAVIAIGVTALHRSNMSFAHLAAITAIVAALLVIFGKLFGFFEHPHRKTEEEDENDSSWSGYVGPLSLILREVKDLFARLTPTQKADRTDGDDSQQDKDP